MKQFAFTLDEALAFADTSSDYVAIVRVQLPKSLLEEFHISRSIDPFIFKNGVVSVEGGQLELLNQLAIDISHIF